MDLSQTSIPIHRTQLRVNPENPWLGLRSYTEDVRDYFFGRDREIQELYERVLHRQLTILFGQSGLGKTSLLRAGLIPRLRQADFVPILIRLIHEPDAPPLETQVIDEISAWLAKATGLESTGTNPQYGLWQLFHDPTFGLAGSAGSAAVKPERIVLIFDQFEEIFTRGESRRRADTARFLEALACLVENRPPAPLREAMETDDDLTDRLLLNASPCKVLLTLREDFLHQLERTRQQMPSMMDNRYELRLLTGPQAYEAVLMPGLKRVKEAEAAGTPPPEPLVSDEMACRIIRFVARAPSDAPLDSISNVPPLLSLMCEQLNARRIENGESTIQAKSLKRLGKTLLLAYYERCLESLPRSVRLLVEEKLISESGYREAVTLDTAIAELRDMDERDSEKALRMLVNRRLLVIEERGGVTRVELTHDVLAGVVYESRTTRRSLSAIRARRNRFVSGFAIAAGSVVALMIAIALYVFMISMGMLQNDREWRSLFVELLQIQREAAQESNSPNGARYIALKRIEERCESFPRTSLGGSKSYLEFQALSLAHLAELMPSVDIPDEYIDADGKFAAGEFGRQSRDEKQVRLLKRAVSHMREFVSSDLEGSNSRGTLVSIQLSLGDAYLNTGQLSDARQTYLQAEETAASFLRDLPDSRARRQDLKTLHDKLAATLMASGYFEQGLSKYQEGLVEARRLRKDASIFMRSFAVLELATSHENIGGAYLQMGRLEDALEEYEAGLKVLDEDSQQSPDVFDFGRHLIQRGKMSLLESRGWVYLAMQRTDKAIADFEEAVQIARRNVEADTRDESKQLSLKRSLDALGDVYLAVGRIKESTEKYEEAQRIAETLAEANPVSDSIQIALAVSWGQLASAALASGNSTEAKTYMESEWKVASQRVEAYKDNAGAKRQLLDANVGLSIVHLNLGETEQALQFADAAVSIARTLLKAEAIPVNRYQLAKALQQSGWVHLDRGETDQAIAEFEEGLKAAEETLKDRVGNADTKFKVIFLQNFLAHAWIQKGDRNKALQYLQRAQEASDRELSSNDHFFGRYNMACYHSLKVLLHSLKYPQPDVGQQAARTALTATAIQNLKDVIEAGEQNLDHIRRDPDFAAIRDLPEFRSLMQPRSPKDE
jgi:tetratricopeptide (TPR) repeat protein